MTRGELIVFVVLAVGGPLSLLVGGYAGLHASAKKAEKTEVPRKGCVYPVDVTSQLRPVAVACSGNTRRECIVCSGGECLRFDPDDCGGTP